MPEMDLLNDNAEYGLEDLAAEYLDDFDTDYICPICGTVCNDYESCGCEMEVNLPND